MVRSNSLRLSIFTLLMIVRFAAESVVASAQEEWLPEGATMFDKEGTIAGFFPSGIQFITKLDSKWLVQVVPMQCDVQVTGKADRSFLHPGLYVKFTGEMDGKGILQQDLKALEIFTPKGKNPSGIFAVGSDESAKPLNRFAAGKYDFRGRVMTYKDGELVVVAGKKITGKVVSGAEIKVNVQDLSIARVDDELKIKGWYLKRNMPREGRPGQSVAKIIEVTLVKPLRAPLPTLPMKIAKLPKGKQPAEPVAAQAGGDKKPPKDATEKDDDKKDGNAIDKDIELEIDKLDEVDTKDAKNVEGENANVDARPKTRKKRNPLSSD